MKVISSTTKWSLKVSLLGCNFKAQSLCMALMLILCACTLASLASAVLPLARAIFLLQQFRKIGIASAGPTLVQIALIFPKIAHMLKIIQSPCSTKMF